jgi:hypothetical protein
MSVMRLIQSTQEQPTVANSNMKSPLDPKKIAQKLIALHVGTQSYTARQGLSQILCFSLITLIPYLMHDEQ